MKTIRSIFKPTYKVFSATLGLLSFLGLSHSAWGQGIEYITFEAEDAVLTAPMTIATDPTASGGQYIYATEKDGGGFYATAHEGGSAEYTLTVAGGDYVIWALAAATGPNPDAHDSLYVSVDGGEEDVWDLFEDFSGTPPTTWTYDQISLRCGGSWENHLCKPFILSLPPGTHTLTINGRESLARLDQFVLTSDFSYVPSSELIILEAEDGVLTAPMTTATDPTASGGQYIYATANEGGTADYTFTVSGGDYVIWALAAATGPNLDSHDSFYVSVDGGAEDVWDLFEDSPGSSPNIWTYEQISLRCGGNWSNHLCKPLILNLQAGTHTLTIGGRESLTRLDKIVLTTDFSYNPSNGGMPTIPSVTIGWIPPQTNEDGTQVNGLSGYKVYSRTTSETYDSVIDVGNQIIATVPNLEPHQLYYFAITAYDDQGNESGYSDELAWVFDDIDIDGMPDSWEVSHFSSISNLAGSATMDQDADGISNFGEFLAGTNPNNPASGTKVQITEVGSEIQVSVRVPPAIGTGYENYDRYFTVEKCNDITQNHWAPVPGL